MSILQSLSWSTTYHAQNTTGAYTTLTKTDGNDFPEVQDCSWINEIAFTIGSITVSSKVRINFQIQAKIEEKWLSLGQTMNLPTHESGCLLTKGTHNSDELNFNLTFNALNRINCIKAMEKGISALRIRAMSVSATEGGYTATNYNGISWDSSAVRFAFKYDTPHLSVIVNSIDFIEKENKIIPIDENWYCIPNSYCAENDVWVSGSISYYPYRILEFGTFGLQKKVGDGDWTTVLPQKTSTLSLMRSSGSSGGGSGGSVIAPTLSSIDPLNVTDTISIPIGDLPSTFNETIQYRLTAIPKINQEYLNAKAEMGEPITDDQSLIEANIVEIDGKEDILSLTCYYTNLSLSNPIMYINSSTNLNQTVGSKGDNWIDKTLSIPINYTVTTDENVILNSYAETWYKLEGEKWEVLETSPLIKTKDEAGYLFKLKQDNGKILNGGRYKLVFESVLPFIGGSGEKETQEIIFSIIPLTPVGTIELSNLSSTPGLIEEGTYTFYETAVLSSSILTTLQVTENISTEEPYLIIEKEPSMPNNKRRITFIRTPDPNKDISISLSYLEYATLFNTYESSSNYITLTVKKSKALSAKLWQNWYDANSKIKDKSVNFRFYDNITIEHSDLGSLKVQNRELYYQEEGSTTKIFILCNEKDKEYNSTTTSYSNFLNTPFLSNAPLYFTITDVYGSSYTEKGPKIAQLRPIEFNAAPFKITSHGYSIDTNYLSKDSNGIPIQVSNGDNLTYEVSIVHKNETNPEGATWIKSYEGTITTGSNFTTTGFEISDNNIDYTCGLATSKLIDALESQNGQPPCIVTQSLYFTDFPNCKYTTKTDSNYNFIREVRDLDIGESINIGAHLYGDNLKYLNGSQEETFTIAVSENFINNPYKNNGFNYETHYKPPVDFILKDNYGSAFVINENFEAIVKVPEYTNDSEITYTVYVNDTKELPSQSFNIAKWSVVDKKIDIIELTYDFNSKNYKVKITYDEFCGGSNNYKNGSLIFEDKDGIKVPYIEIYDENGSNKVKLIQEGEYWVNDTTATQIVNEETNSEFYNFIVEVTFINTAGDTLTIKSEPYLISKLIDLTIRRGRVGINVEQNFPFKDENKSLSTLEIHQRGSTQGNQLETIKIVGSSVSEKGPAIGFYDIEGNCYGRIYGGLDQAIKNLTVMTSEEVKALFKTAKGGDINE